MKESMASSVSSSAASICLSTFAEFLGLSTESTLVAVHYVSLYQVRVAIVAYILPSSVREKGQP
jgi:hypothetical protein